MRVRLTSLVAIGAILSLSPQRLQSQSDPNFKLSTSNAQAAAQFRAGVTDFQNISFESANSHFKAAIDADPNFGLARVLYAGTGPVPPGQLEAELNRGVADAAAHGNTNELLLAAAYRENTLGHTEAAKALFGAAAQLMPNDRIIALSVPGGFFAGNLQFLRDFATRFPDYPLVYNTLAYTEWVAGNKEAALAAAKRQVELNPSAPNPHDTYAELLQWNGDFLGAATHYKQAAALTPKFPEAYAGLAETEAAQGHFAQARSYLNQAIANAWSEQQKINYLRQIAGTYAMEGASGPTIVKALEAAATEAKAAGDLSQAANLYSQIAATQAAAGNAAAAHQALATATGLGGPVPWNVHYFGGMAHSLLKHWPPAQDELAKLKADSTAPKSRVAALEGNLLIQQGKPADALRVLMAADTTDLLVQNRIAEAHAALGHTDEAAKWYARINSNYAINLFDWTNVNSRRRARVAVAKR